MSHYDVFSPESLKRMCQRGRFPLPATLDKESLINTLTEGKTLLTKAADVAKAAKQSRAEAGQEPGAMGQGQSARARKKKRDTVNSLPVQQNNCSDILASTSITEESAIALEIPAMEMSPIGFSSKRCRTIEKEAEVLSPVRKRFKYTEQSKPMDRKVQTIHESEDMTMADATDAQDEKMTTTHVNDDQDEILTTNDKQGFTVITDPAGIVRLTNDDTSIRTSLSNQFFIAIPTEDIKIKNNPARKMLEFFEAFSPAGVHASITEWFVTFGEHEMRATACFEHFMVRKYKGKDFRMELIGPNGEVLRKCKKNVLEPEDEFDREWVGFEWLRRLDAYVAD